MKKCYVLLCVLLLVGCSRVEREALNVSDAKFVANVYDNYGHDYLAVLDAEGAVVRDISFANGTYPSVAAITDEAIYWQTLKSVTSNCLNDFVNVPDAYGTTTPFHFNDVVKVAASKIMFKNGIYEAATGKYWGTGDANILLCDWLDEDSVLAVSAEGIVRYDACLKRASVLKSNETSTYYQVVISPDKTQVAYLVYDNFEHKDFLMVADSDFSNERVLVDVSDKGWLSASNIVWAKNDTVLFQANSPRSDIYQVSLSNQSILNITNTPEESELITSLEEDGDRLYFFCSLANDIGVFDLAKGKLAKKIDLKANNIVSVSSLY